VLLAATTMPEAIIWAAVIICLLGIPVIASAMKKHDLPEARDFRDSVLQQQEMLAELRALRDDIGELRAQVSELDRMLKSVG